jgi:4-hydroxybenzoyl-CoA thioesterase
MAVFAVDIPVRFQHTDPAGIVFYPRYFEMINQVVEDWFAEALGVDFQTLHRQHLCGVPTVRIESDFKRPSRLGEVLSFALRVADLGKSSFTLDLSASCGGEERLRARAVLAYVRLEGLSPVPIPPELRLAMERFCDGGEAQGVA